MNFSTKHIQPIAERLGVSLLAIWLVITVYSQHPDRGFDKLRKIDPTGLLIPNWRFFAPEPAVDDTYLLYRLYNPNTDEYTEWDSANQAQQRRFIHAIWFPGRREEKAVFDVTAALLSNANSGIPITEAVKLSTFEIITNYVRRESIKKSRNKHLDFSQIQWMIVRFSGYAENDNLVYDYVSPLLERKFDEYSISGIEQ